MTREQLDALEDAVLDAVSTNIRQDGWRDPWVETSIDHAAIAAHVQALLDAERARAKGET